jgi:hypothetical protein
MPRRKKHPEPQSASNDTTTARGIFKKALQGENHGPNPGLADVRIRVGVYSAFTRTEHRLPGRYFQVYVGSLEEVDDLLRVLQKATERWIEGNSD